MGLWIRTASGRGAGRAAPRVQLCLLFSILACSSGSSDPLVIEPPTFGAGTASIHIALGPGYVEGSLEVSLDRRPVRNAFDVTGDGASAVVPLGQGVHRLSARARFATVFACILSRADEARRDLHCAVRLSLRA